MSKHLPTADEMIEIVKRFEAHPSVTKVKLRTVLHVSVEVGFECDRNGVYDLEGRIMDENPDLLFEFRVTTK